MTGEEGNGLFFVDGLGWVGSGIFTCLGWVGSRERWVGFGWVTKIGPMAMSDLDFHIPSKFRGSHNKWEMMHAMSFCNAWALCKFVDGHVRP